MIDTGLYCRLFSRFRLFLERAATGVDVFLEEKELFLATVQGTGTVYLQSLPFLDWLIESFNMLLKRVDHQRRRFYLGGLGRMN